MENSKDAIYYIYIYCCTDWLDRISCSMIQNNSTHLKIKQSAIAKLTCTVTLPQSHRKENEWLTLSWFGLFWMRQHNASSPIRLVNARLSLPGAFTEGFLKRPGSWQWHMSDFRLGIVARGTVIDRSIGRVWTTKPWTRSQSHQDYIIIWLQ